MSRPLPGAGLLLPPREPRRVPALHGLLWLQQGFRLFTAQPGRWSAVLGLWLWLTIVLPSLLSWALDRVRQLAMIALQPVGLDQTFAYLLDVLPALAPLAMLLLFPVMLAGLMIGCQAVARGEPLRPGHLIAGFEREPGRLVTVGGVNAVGQILMSAVIGWLVHDHLGDVDLSGLDELQGAEAAARASLILQRIADMLPEMLPVLVLQTVLMAVLWFTTPLLAFHEMGALTAVRASIRACVRNPASMGVYSLATLVLVALVSALVMSAQVGVVFALIALIVTVALVTTGIGSIYVSYRDIFDVDPH